MDSIIIQNYRVTIERLVVCPITGRPLAKAVESQTGRLEGITAREVSFQSVSSATRQGPAVRAPSEADKDDRVFVDVSVVTDGGR
jgi:hypothetical protein